MQPLAPEELGKARDRSAVDWADGERETPKGRPYLPSNHATVRILIIIIMIIWRKDEESTTHLMVRLLNLVLQCSQLT